MPETTVHLTKAMFGEAERPLLESGTGPGALRAGTFRYRSGIEGLRLANGRGELVVLPFYGQMVWSARFDGVDLPMRSMFDGPRPAADIAGTYGCFAFLSGLLRNGRGL